MRLTIGACGAKSLQYNANTSVDSMSLDLLVLLLMLLALACTMCVLA